jgi:hypothetical protein
LASSEGPRGRQSRLGSPPLCVTARGAFSHLTEGESGKELTAQAGLHRKMSLSVTELGLGGTVTGKHSPARKRAPKQWSDRLYDGRLRAQCRDCFAAGLRAAESVRVCSECSARSQRRRLEAAAFRDFLGLGEAGSQKAAST